MPLCNGTLEPTFQGAHQLECEKVGQDYVKKRDVTTFDKKSIQHVKRYRYEELSRVGNFRQELYSWISREIAKYQLTQASCAIGVGIDYMTLSSSRLSERLILLDFIINPMTWVRWREHTALKAAAEHQHIERFLAL